MNRPRALLVGPRAGLAKALRRRRVPFVVWSDHPVPARGAEEVVVAPLPSSHEAVEQVMGPLLEDGWFTHVIAGTEAAVVPAAHARRIAGARAAPFTIAVRCRDKLEMKRALIEHGIPMTDFLDGAESLEPAAILERLGSPVVVKDRLSSGGRQLRLAHDEAELGPSPHPGRILERHVDAPECSVESFLQDGEIHFTNITEYLVKSSVNVVPAQMDPAMRDAVLALNERVLKALRITWGMAHLELYLTEQGPLFGEIALRPPGGYIVELISLAYDFDVWNGIVAVEMHEPFEFPHQPTSSAAAWVVHPGAGTVAGVHGLEAVTRIAGVKEAKVKVAPGDEISARVGTGEEVGHVLLQASSRDALLSALDEAQRTLRLDLSA